MYNIGDVVKIEVESDSGCRIEEIKIIDIKYIDGEKIYIYLSGDEEIWMSESCIIGNDKDFKEASEVIKDKLNEYLEECYNECVGYSEEVIDVYMSLIKEFKEGK